MVSIIIPTYNEEDQIAQTIRNVLAATFSAEVEILVVDGGSTDNTVALAQSGGAHAVVSERKGRGAQMNVGAAMAQGNILYFLHADSIPPPNFVDTIQTAVQQGFVGGSFRLAFDHPHWFLKVNAWFTRFNLNGVRFGDQSLFVLPEVFRAIGGFREDLVVMEDQEIIHRIKKNGPFKVMNAQVITSARKYLNNGVYKMQGIFYLIWAGYYLGLSQERLVKLYKLLIKKHKL